MFLTGVYKHENPVADRKSEQTIAVKTHHKKWIEISVKLSLTIVESTGYEEAVDNSECWNPIIRYLDDQFDKYLEVEMKIDRVAIPDTRVAACRFFIDPTGHGLTH